jgi:regulator of RNase E activity RraB
LAAEFATDDDVLASLKSNGDVPSAVRSIDVSFRGDVDRLEVVARSLEADGFSIIDRTRTEDDTPWIFLAREQTAERPAIHALTQYCPEIADEFNVTYDGWGCLASNERGAISNENPA